MRSLWIDTSTERGGIAYGQSSQLLFQHAFPFGLNQSHSLIPSLVEFLSPFGAPSELDFIAVGIGPGSYTGIRLGVSVAQALAYSWKKPLVGVSSLQGFVPFDETCSFAAILDARIGGVYVQKGRKCKGEVQFEGSPSVMSLKDAALYLEEVDTLVTPSVASLQKKFASELSQQKWRWVERGPSSEENMRESERKYTKGEYVIPPQQLSLLYLRETEAERAKKSK